MKLGISQAIEWLQKHWLEKKKQILYNSWKEVSSRRDVVSRRNMRFFDKWAFYLLKRIFFRSPFCSIPWSRDNYVPSKLQLLKWNPIFPLQHAQRSVICNVPCSSQRVKFGSHRNYEDHLTINYGSLLSSVRTM